MSDGSVRFAADGSVRFTAYAKVNLYLHVTGRRSDGYHQLDSLIVFAGLGDDVVVRPAENLTLSLQGPFAGDVPKGGDNLVIRAARELASVAKPKAAASITLTKNLPVAAGLGGGSADAAAVLQALVRLWKIDMAKAKLAELALQLGADVPVCLAGGCVFVSGIGEQITLAPPLPDTWLVLVNPRVPLSTPGVFAAREGAFSAAAPFSKQPVDVIELSELLAVRGNDLEQTACRLVPEIANVLAALAGQNGALLSRMSGSGASCFAIFADEHSATTAAANLAEKHSTWWIASAPLMESAKI